jgi:hypothetical protein
VREKQFTHAVTFFTTIAMYQTIKNIADTRRVALSEILRQIVKEYLASTDNIAPDKASD